MSLFRIVPLFVCACVASQTASAQEIRVRPVGVDDTSVSGFVIPAPNSPGAGFFVEVYDGNGSSAQFLDRIPITTFESDGGFRVTLRSPLAAGQEIRVGGPKLTTQVVITPPAVPVLRPQLYDGTRTVRGYLPSAAGAASVRVYVRRSGLESEFGEQYVQLKSTRDVDASGAFTATLDDPLVAGQIVQAQAFTAANVSGAPSLPVTVTDPGSWGRARAYFAGGVIFSKEREEFSEQDMAMTFALDKSWLQRADFRLPADDAVRRLVLAGESPAAEGTDDDSSRSAANQRRPGAGSGRWFPRQLNTFFDARLTALPVLAQEAAAPDTETPGTPDGGGDAPPGGSTPFAASRRAAAMQIGVYAPIYGPQTSWVYEGAVNTFFVAPLFRFGIQTITDDGSGQTVNASGEPDDVFNMWGIGVGLGHQRLSGSTNQTPEIISYLHITWGKAEAFEFREREDGPVISKGRVFVEGRLKIPDTPMQIGFDANLGDRRDDIRFIFGTRFDVGEAFSRLRGTQP